MNFLNYFNERAKLLLSLLSLLNELKEKISLVYTEAKWKGKATDFVNLMKGR